jgi:hypothetical protein
LFCGVIQHGQRGHFIYWQLAKDRPRMGWL